MELNKVLDLLLNEKYYINNFERDGITSVNIIFDYYQVFISSYSPYSKEININFRFLYDLKGQQPTYFPGLKINNIEEIKDFLNEICDNEINNENSIIDYTYPIIELFKLLLAEQPLPKEYSSKFIKNNNFPSGILHLIENKTQNTYSLNFDKFSFPNNLNQNKSLPYIHSPLGLLKLDVITSQENGGSFTFVIPGYELHKYPLLKDYNKIPQVNSNVDEWVNEIINFKNVEKNPFSVALHDLMLDNELSKNNLIVKKNKI